VQASVKGLSETRAISLDFREVGLRTLLDVVSRNSGINFVLDKDIRQDLRVTVYLRSAKVENAIDLIVNSNQLAKKIIDDRTILIYPNTPDKQREHQEQVVRVFYLANAEAKAAAAFLKAMLKLREPFVDERSNMVALRDSPENIQLAERLIGLYDTSDPEVLLELEVLEVSSSRLTNLGVKFPDTFTLTPLAPDGGGTGLTLGNITGLGRDRLGLSVAGLLVNLKRTVGDVNTLSAPRIRVKNKEKAKILIGDKIPLVTATVGTGGFVSDSVSYIDVGLKLDVEPTIYPDEEVSIKVALEVSSLGTQVKTSSGTLAYQIGTRTAATLLRLRDGQTQLLAGLISRDERSNASRVPGIGDLPVLGRLFSDQTDSTNRTELVLAITPHVLRNLRQPDAAASELWVGTDAAPRLRAVGGRIDLSANETPIPAVLPAGAAMQPANSGSTPSSARVDLTPPSGVVGLAQRSTPDGKSAFVPTWHGPADVQAGDTFEIHLGVQAGVPVRGMPIMLSYPKDRLNVLEVIEGDFFRKNDMPTNFAKSVDAAEGRIRVGVQRTQNLGASGKGEVISIRFKAIAPGSAEVAVIGMEPMGQGVPVERPALPVIHRVQIK
jgi:general secretion pathway protein D